MYINNLFTLSSVYVNQVVTEYLKCYKYLTICKYYLGENFVSLLSFFLPHHYSCNLSVWDDIWEVVGIQYEF